VPQDLLDLADEPSQFLASQLPQAFKPQMLATLEKQCRSFMM
jgi:hypothetical protein